ncbi:trypsin-like peptidase domain-containing protein [Candidatus Dojkabacteria bacterium]|nr:trypsin-like peptidase domain-containing protein [Candidatus Dojkabacteria bacterium]
MQITESSDAQTPGNPNVLPPLPPKVQPSTSPGKSYKLLSLFGVVLILAGLGGLVFLGVSKFFLETQGKDKLKIEGVDPEIGEELTKQLVYSAESQEIEYYSPTLDILLNYPKDKFIINEDYLSISVSLTETGAYSTYAKLKLYKKEGIEDINKELKGYYEDIYDNVETVEEKTQEDELGYLRIKYLQESFLKEGESEEIYRTFLVRGDLDEYVFIDIKETSGTKTTDKYLSQFSDLVQSVQLHPENIAEEIEYIVKEGAIKVRFDRKKWNVAGQSDYSLSLGFRSSDYEQAEELKYFATGVYISAYSTYRDDLDEAYFKDEIAKERANAQEAYLEKGLEFLVEEETLQIGGVDFYFTKYRYTAYGEDTVKTIYRGYNPTVKAIISISTYEPYADSEGGKEVRRLIDYIEVLTDETSSAKRNNNVLGVSSLEFERAAIIGKPAVVHIFNKTCTKLKVNEISDMPNVSGNTYTLCMAGFGSGAYISSDGHIITNAHVGAMNPKDVIIDAALYSLEGEASSQPLSGFDQDGFVSDVLNDLAVYYQNLYPDINLDSYYVQESMFEDAISVILLFTVDEAASDYATIDESTFTNYIQKSKPFEVDPDLLDLSNKSDMYEAEVVAYKEIDSFYQMAYDSYAGEESGLSVPDLAILKVSDSDVKEFPGVELGDYQMLNVGERIVVIGFPGSAENEALFSVESTTIPTITTGTISAIKPNFDSTFNLIQIDASISHGNSGGPIYNSDGKIVAVATYGLTSEEAADFNAGVSVEEVQKFISENNVENKVGKITKYISDGLDDFGKQYYKKAVEKFEEAKALNPQLEDLLDPLIKIAQEKIEKGEDKTPLFTIGDLEFGSTEAVVVIAIVVCLSIGFLLVILILILKKRTGGSSEGLTYPAQMEQQMRPPGSMPMQQSQQVVPSQVQQTQEPFVQTSMPEQAADPSVQPVGTSPVQQEQPVVPPVHPEQPMIQPGVPIQPIDQSEVGQPTVPAQQQPPQPIVQQPENLQPEQQAMSVQTDQQGLPSEVAQPVHPEQPIREPVVAPQDTVVQQMPSQGEVQPPPVEQQPDPSALYKPPDPFKV